MLLNSLISHSAELFRIIWKSHQPSDTIASNYFRSKKYIGSNDRKFISEATFAALRIKLLAEYCLSDVFSLINDNFILSKNLKQSILENNKEVLIITATCLIASSQENIKKYFEFISLFEKINQLPESFLEQIKTFLAIYFNVNISLSSEIIDSINNKFKALDQKISDLNIVHNLEDKINLIQSRFSIPSWIIKSWITQNQFSILDAIELADSFLYSAPITLRANEHFVKREKIINILRDIKIESYKGKISPHAIIIDKRTNLHTFDLYKKGLIEIQDEGSQIVSFCVAPEKYDTILDACAGAGGKTLHLASLQSDKGKIVASDIEFMRLKEIYFRAKRAGYNSISTILLNPKKKGKNPFNLLFDKILVDAPCSGTGTVRRMPMQKYRLNPQLLKKLSARQYEILSYYSQFLKTGGYLIYSTCSLMYDENDAVINKFLNDNPNFIPDPFNQYLKTYGINIHGFDENSYKITLTPSKFECDGFFIARMKKIK
jgi:16S rRNA (cytosine967-C5)-methyltransferase